jgi:hypothetical protein
VLRQRGDEQDRYLLADTGRERDQRDEEPSDAQRVQKDRNQQDRRRVDPGHGHVALEDQKEAVTAMAKGR